MFGANPFGSGFFADGYAVPNSAPQSLTVLDTVAGSDTGFAAIGIAGSDLIVGADSASSLAAYRSVPGGGGGGFGCNPFGWGFDGASYLGVVVVPPMSGPTVDGGIAADSAVLGVLYALTEGLTLTESALVAVVRQRLYDPLAAIVTDPRSLAELTDGRSIIQVVNPRTMVG